MHPLPLLPKHPLDELLMRHLPALLGVVDAPTLELLRGSLQWVELAAGQTLMRQGEPGDAMYLLLRGRLRTYMADDSAGKPGSGQRAVRVMIDTGASVVVLTPADASRLGLRLKAGDFSRTVITASGPVRAAPVALWTVAVAGTRVEQVEALVVEQGLPHSLLGMSYLGRLSSFSATPAEITLRP